MSNPSTRMRPPASSIMRKSAMSRVVLPDPVRPTIPICMLNVEGCEAHSTQAAKGRTLVQQAYNMYACMCSVRHPSPVTLLPCADMIMRIMRICTAWKIQACQHASHLLSVLHMEAHVTQAQRSTREIAQAHPLKPQVAWSHEGRGGNSDTFDWGYVRHLISHAL